MFPPWRGHTSSDLMMTLTQIHPESCSLWLPAISSPLSLVFTRRKKVCLFVPLFEGLFALFAGKPLCCTPHSPLHLCELVETITGCLLLTANSPCFGSRSNLIHNWKWLLRSIWYAFVLLTSATQAPPGGCFREIFFFLSFSFVLSVILTPVHLFICLSSLMCFLDNDSHFGCNCSKFQFQPKCAFKQPSLSGCHLSLASSPPCSPARQNAFFHVGACTYIIRPFALKWDQSLSLMFQTWHQTFHSAQDSRRLLKWLLFSFPYAVHGAARC